jgi:hypothetical protein
MEYVKLGCIILNASRVSPACKSYGPSKDRLATRPTR